MATKKVTTKKPKTGPFQSPVSPNTAPVNIPISSIPTFFRAIPKDPKNDISQAPHTVMKKKQALDFVAWLRKTLPEFSWSVPHAVFRGGDLLPFDDSAIAPFDLGTWYVLKPPVPGMPDSNAIQLSSVVDMLSGQSASPLSNLARFYAQLFPPGQVSYPIAYGNVAGRTNDIQIVTDMSQIFFEPPTRPLVGA